MWANLDSKLSVYDEEEVSKMWDKPNTAFSELKYMHIFSFKACKSDVAAHIHAWKLNHDIC